MEAATIGKFVFSKPHDWSEDPFALTPEEEDLIQLFRQLNEEEQQKILDFLQEQNR